MPRKTKNAAPVDAGLPEIPKELLDQFVTGPMTAETVEAVMRKFKKAVSWVPGARSFRLWPPVRAAPGRT
jgi:hypothetical protein